MPYTPLIILSVSLHDRAAIQGSLGVPTHQDLTKLSLISIELLLIFVQRQFRILIVIQNKFLVVDFVSLKA